MTDTDDTTVSKMSQKSPFLRSLHPRRQIENKDKYAHDIVGYNTKEKNENSGICVEIFEENFTGKQLLSKNLKEEMELA